MSLPTSFYKEIILSSAKTFRAEKNCVVGSEKWRISVETASVYISLTNKILDIFANDPEKLWNYASIQQKMGESINGHQLKLIIDELVENKFVEIIEKEGNINYGLTKSQKGDLPFHDKIALPLVTLVSFILMKKLILSESEFEEMMSAFKFTASLPLLAVGFGLEFIGSSIKNLVLPSFLENLAVTQTQPRRPYFYL